MNVISKEKSQRLFTLLIPCVVTIDLKTDDLDRVSIPTKIVATFDVEHPMLGPQMITPSLSLLLKFECTSSKHQIAQTPA